MYFLMAVMLKQGSVSKEEMWRELQHMRELFEEKIKNMELSAQLRELQIKVASEKQVESIRIASEIQIKAIRRGFEELKLQEREQNKQLQLKYTRETDSQVGLKILGFGLDITATLVGAYFGSGPSSFARPNGFPRLNAYNH